MNPLAIWELRSNLSSYLEKVKFEKKVIVFWDRHKKEYLLTKYPDIDINYDLFDLQNSLEEVKVQKDYYKGLQNTMSDWVSDEHDDLFE